MRSLAVTLLILHSFGGMGSLYSQNKVTPIDIQAFWPSIEKQLDSQASDTSLFFIIQQVRSHCGDDEDCLFSTYYAVIGKLERCFNLPAAIYVTNEIAKIAHRQHDLEKEATAYKNLGRFHHAIGNERQAVLSTDRALALYEKAGNKVAITQIRMIKLEQSLSYREISNVLPEMNALLADAVKKNDTPSVRFLQLRLVEFAIDAKRYDEAAKHIEAIEKIPVSNPLKRKDYRIVITAALGRANLAMAQNDLPKAAGFYLKTLRFSEQEPSRWIEVHVLNSLAKLEWERGNIKISKSYLETARVKAEKLELHDLLAQNYEMQAKVAEAEGRFAAALSFYKKQQFQNEKFKEPSADFDTQKHYLQQEKDQLALEKDDSVLDLHLKKTQLRYSLIIIILFTLLALGLTIGLYKHRNAKRKLASQNLLIEQQTERLMNLDAAKSRFFANVSHELRTPLTLLLGPVSTLLKENRLSDKQAQLLQLAQQSGQQLGQLITDILDLGKLEMGKMELDEKPTELATFFRMHLAQFESLAESRGIGFSFDIAVADDSVVHLDQAKCRQILNNLLANAFKFSPSGGRVAAALALSDGWLQLSIADTGPGIHPDDLPHLFDRYFQTTRPDKPAEGGTGIGLALCHEYVQLFGGNIEVDSALGEGSVFRVAFPVALASGAGAYSETTVSPTTVADSDVWPQSFAASETSASPYTAVGKPTVLVVEDNPDLQAYIRLILSEKYHVVTAENGQAALGVMGYELGDMSEPTSFQKTHPSSLITPDLILSDLMMPVMDGHQLLERLKSDDATRHIPVIMLTARADARDKLQALRIGVDDYLHKPFDEEELLARIENLLRNQASRQQVVAGEVEPEAAHPRMSAPDREWLETFEGYIKKHCANDTLSVSGLAHEFAMSESTLLRQLKRLTGLSPVQYVQEVRLEEARRLLESRSYNSIAQVASKVGFQDTRSFSRRFKQRYGKLPSEV